jgi:hypothetical protein
MGIVSPNHTCHWPLLKQVTTKTSESSNQNYRKADLDKGHTPQTLGIIGKAEVIHQINLSVTFSKISIM